MDIVKDVFCPYCGEVHKDLNLEVYAASQQLDDKDDGMGPSFRYYIDCDGYPCKKCDKWFKIKGYMDEYPVDVKELEEIAIKPSSDLIDYVKLSPNTYSQEDLEEEFETDDINYCIDNGYFIISKDNKVSFK